MNNQEMREKIAEKKEELELIAKAHEIFYKETDLEITISIDNAIRKIFVLLMEQESTNNIGKSGFIGMVNKNPKPPQECKPIELLRPAREYWNIHKDTYDTNLAFDQNNKINEIIERVNEMGRP